MKKTIVLMVHLINKSNIPLPKGARKKEGGSSSYNKERCPTLVASSSSSSSFSTLHPYSGPSILMGDDSEIQAKGVGRIDLEYGYFNNVLFVHDIVV